MSAIQTVDMKRLLKDNLDTIFGYAIFITGNRDRALDLMQETIASVLSKKNAYEERDAFRTWIFRVLKNNYLNRVTSEALSREIAESEMRRLEEDEPIEHPDPQSLPEDSSDPILREKILHAFSQMPIEHRDVCYHVDVEGLSYEETSRRLSIPVGTVMSRLHRGREFLKSKLMREAEELHIISFKGERHAHGKAM